MLGKPCRRQKKRCLVTTLLPTFPCDLRRPGGSTASGEQRKSHRDSYSSILPSFPIQFTADCGELLKRSLEVFDDFGGDDVGIGEIGAVSEASRSAEVRSLADESGSSLNKR